MVELVDHMRLRRAEARAKAANCAGASVLPADRQHLAGVERALDLGERFRRQRARDVGVDLDAETRGEGPRSEHSMCGHRPRLRR